MGESYVLLFLDYKISALRYVFLSRLLFSLEEKFAISCSVDRNAAGAIHARSRNGVAVV